MKYSQKTRNRSLLGISVLVKYLIEPVKHAHMTYVTIDGQQDYEGNGDLLRMAVYELRDLANDKEDIQLLYKKGYGWLQKSWFQTYYCLNVQFVDILSDQIDKMRALANEALEGMKQ